MKIHKCNGLQPLASKSSLRKREDDGLMDKPNNDVNYLSNIQKANANYTQSQIIIPYNNNNNNNNKNKNIYTKQSVISLQPSTGFNDLNRTSQSCPTISENGMIFQPMQHTQSAPILQHNGKKNVQFCGHLPYNNYSNYSNEHMTSTNKFNNSVQKNNRLIEHVAEPNMWQPTINNWLSYPNNIQNKKTSYVGNNNLSLMHYPQMGDNNMNSYYFKMNSSSINNNNKNNNKNDNNNNNGTMMLYNPNNSMNSMIRNINPPLQDIIGYNTTANMFTPSMNEVQYNENKNNIQQYQQLQPLNTRFSQSVMSSGTFPPGYNFGGWNGLVNGAYPTYGVQGGRSYGYGGQNNTLTGYNMDTGISVGMFGMNGGNTSGINCHTMNDPGLGVLYGSGVPNIPFVPQDYCPQFLNDLQYYGNLGGSQIWPGPI